MPCIEGPKMDWTVNDGLYHTFLKWHLKCENVLECELAMLSERRKCKKVITCRGDFGMDQYVSWSLLPEELMLGTIWDKFEEFCKSQSKEVRARFDLLTSFRQGNRPVKNGIMLSKPKLLWLHTPQKQPRDFTGIFLGSSLKMKNLSPRQSMTAT